MYNKKIIAKGLIASILLFNTPIDSMAIVIEDYKLTVVDNTKNKFEGFINNLFDKFKKTKDVVKINRNIRAGTVYEITLNEGQYIPDLSGNPQGYETIIVSTINNKKLVKQDYDNLRASGIPNIDLSNSSADSITSGAFSNATFLRSFKFPNGVFNIESHAFKDCINLSENLIIPNTVTSIGDAAFQGCSSLTGNLTIPNSVNYIGIAAFANCTGFNGNLTISNSLNYINNDVFSGCSGLTGNLVIPKSITSIGDNAFRNCNNLNGTLTIPNTVTSIGSNAFRACSKLNGILNIPNSVTSIGNEAFVGCIGFTGELVIPPSLTRIGDKAFEGCKGFTGNLLIPDTLKNLGYGVFNNCTNINKISIKVNSSDSSSDYKRDLCFKLPDTVQTVIDIPYNFDTTGTWMESTITNRIIGKPVIKNIINGQEVELEGVIGKNISLYIPAPYKEENISVLKDGTIYSLPIKNNENKYIFNEEGRYTVTIITDLGNTSVIDFEIEGKSLENAEIAIEEAISSKNPEDIEAARDLVNKLPESSKKDEFQGILDSIFPKIEFEIKNTTSNFDIYIKSENIIGLSLNTNMVMFDDFNGVDDVEKLNAVNLTVDSSLPYELNAYLPTEIQSTDKSTTMNKNILNIRESEEGNYKTFTSINNKLVLKDNNEPGDDALHNIDLKLKGGIAYKKDIYKATVKFEVQQK